MRSKGPWAVMVVRELGGELVGFSAGLKKERFADRQRF